MFADHDNLVTQCWVRACQPLDMSGRKLIVNKVFADCLRSSRNQMVTHKVVNSGHYDIMKF